MGSPIWWGYAKNMIRQYPDLKRAYNDLHTQSITADISGMPHSSGAGRVAELIALRQLPPVKQKEYEAVTRAIEITKRLRTGKSRLALIELVFWKKTHNIAGAATRLCYSKDTAEKYHREFIHLVWECYVCVES